MMFPSSICEIIKQPTQFPWKLTHPIKDHEYFLLSLDMADRLLTHKEIHDPTRGALFFASREDWWFHSMINKGHLVETYRYGGHRFYFWKSKKKHYE